MTTQDLLKLLRLLSALESWGFSTSNRFPDYLHDDLCNAVQKLEDAILKAKP